MWSWHLKSIQKLSGGTYLHFLPQVRILSSTLSTNFFKVSSAPIYIIHYLRILVENTEDKLKIALKHLCNSALSTIMYAMRKAFFFASDVIWFYIEGQRTYIHLHIPTCLFLNDDLGNVANVLSTFSLFLHT